MKLYTHYKEANELKDTLSRDNNEIDLMRIFGEKIQGFREKGIEINMKQLKKALTYVLRQSADIAMDGETTSSAGSD